MVDKDLVRTKLTYIASNLTLLDGKSGLSLALFLIDIDQQYVVPSRPAPACSTRLSRTIGVPTFRVHAAPARLASASARTRVPWPMASGEAYSSGRWLKPERHGIKSIAVGAMREIKSES